jgi:hypothetical protein|tara:strand:- start:10918 stop:11406 length:489 start_codon:yes stop_codon:yes gene_type:complete
MTMLGLNPKKLLAVSLKRADQESEISGDQTGDVEYFYQVPENQEADIDSLSIQIKCPLDKTDGFGSGSALPKSLSLDIQDKEGNSLLDLAKGRDIKTNDDLLFLVDGNISEDSKVFFGTRYYKAPYSAPIKLSDEMKIVLTVDHDFTSHFSKMYFVITGVIS